ncbi:efflux transporter outer membrane subunit [Variovorax sp. J22R133]|uniref:efflux transporter outer membrane subunit n=1 Tax=Variovorax brevis TaxID=3053503 RepID=UPI002574C331|nr:efflux transporter outer membrane subunit [Variovorax sp. J22R133]MDM0113999.1 efflux transporter outer membrane subunit [Variovorax sp. J22R133]
MTDKPSNPAQQGAGATRTLSAALATITAAMISACAQLPAREAEPQVKPVTQYATAQSFAAAPAPWPVDAWWRNYEDAQLDQLIAEALADAPSVAAADARLRRAQAFVQSADAALMPQVGANASITSQKQSYNYLSPRNATPEGWNGYGRATLDFSWEIDFWGKNRAALAATTSDADAARADAAQARIILATSIASAYAELARQHAALDTAQAALTVRSKTADLLTRRFDNGLETLPSVKQVDARRASAQAEVLSIEEQLALQRNRIAALVGAGPDRALSISRPTVRLQRAFGLPSQLPAELIGRRPDVVAARLRAEATAKRIDQARAAFYPNVNLVAFIGVQSLGLDMLSKNGSSIGSIGPAISLPIFDGGRLRAQLGGANADYAQAVASYDGTVVQALQDVADAAVSQKALGPQLARTDEAVGAAREAWRLQNNRYEGGLSNYLEVLSAEDTLLANLRTQSDLQSRAFTLDVALVRALGGGYVATQN